MNSISTLRDELARQQAQIISLQRALDEPPDAGLGKGAAAFVQRERDRALLNQLKGQVAEIERDLADADAREYGVCKRCGRTIHPDRLAVLPATSVCICCAKGGRRDR